MEEEEEIQQDDCSEVYPRLYDSRSRPYQSQWLQTTRSDSDVKTQKILDLLHGDGDSITERAEMFYEKRPELIERVQDLHKSYSSLAENYDLLIRSDHLKPPCPPLKSNQNGHSLQEYSREIKEISEFALNLDYLDEKANGLEPGEEPSNPKKMGFDPNGQEERERAREELMLKVSKLIGENLEEQAELVRRYNEEKEMVRNLRSQINKLMDENRVLKSCLSLPNTKNNNQNVAAAAAAAAEDMKGSRSQCHGSKLCCIGRFGGCS